MQHKHESKLKYVLISSVSRSKDKEKPHKDRHQMEKGHNWHQTASVGV